MFYFPGDYNDLHSVGDDADKKILTNGKSIKELFLIGYTIANQKGELNQINRNEC